MPLPLTYSTPRDTGAAGRREPPSARAPGGLRSSVDPLSLLPAFAADVHVDDVFGPSDPFLAWTGHSHPPTSTGADGRGHRERAREARRVEAALALAAGAAHTGRRFAAHAQGPPGTEADTGDVSFG
jgi:hypothetical protein